MNREKNLHELKLTHFHSLRGIAFSVINWYDFLAYKPKSLYATTI